MSAIELMANETEIDEELEAISYAQWRAARDAESKPAARKAHADEDANDIFF